MKTGKHIKMPTTVSDAIAIFDLAADRTKENHQTAAWKILRAEVSRLREYEIVAGMFAIEKAEMRIRRDKLAVALRDLVDMCESIGEFRSGVNTGMTVGLTDGYDEGDSLSERRIRAAREVLDSIASATTEN